MPSLKCPGRLHTKMYLAGLVRQILALLPGCRARDVGGADPYHRPLIPTRRVGVAIYEGNPILTYAKHHGRVALTLPNLVLKAVALGQLLSGEPSQQVEVEHRAGATRRGADDLSDRRSAPARDG